ncbi:MAG: YciI family protein [Bauldia sp.]
MTIVKGAEGLNPPAALLQAIGKLREEATKAGAFVEMGGLLPSTTGARVRLADGKMTVTDGPFSEAKEVIGGYAIYNVRSKEEALEWTRRFMNLHKQHWPDFEGETELRQMREFGPPA